MTRRGTTVLVAITIVLAAAASVALLVGSAPTGESDARRRSFQGLVGGLGFGAATDLSSSAARFDRRLGALPDRASTLLPTTLADQGALPDLLQSR